MKHNPRLIVNLSYENRPSVNRLSQVDFSEKTYPRQMLLAILDEGLFCMVYTWPSGSNHTSDKDALPDKLKRAILAVARITLNTPGKRMTVSEFSAAVRNQFSGNRLRVSVALAGRSS